MMIVVGFRKTGLRSKKMMRLANQKDNISSILMTEAIPVTRVSIGGVGGRCDLINQLPTACPLSLLLRQPQ